MKSFLEIPLDYQLLPPKYFKFNDIPPPLVLKNWFSSFIKFSNSSNDLEHSDEDCIPLVHLKSKLQNFNKKKPNIRQKGFVPNDALNKEHFINRKRGRPRKELKECAPSIEDNVCANNEDSSSDKDDFQNDQTNVFSYFPQSKTDVSFEVKEEYAELNWEEHDYYKPDSKKISIEEGIKKDNSNEKKEVKKEKTKIQRIRIENMKMSFICTECGKSFSAASTLKSHLRIHNNTLLKCMECQKGFTTKYLLKCHMRIHSGDLFMCHKCGKGFTTAELLKVHSRGHTGDRPFVCNICNKSFPSASNMTQHKLTHNSEKKFLCFQCGSSFNQKRCLDGHMLTHAEKNHICTVCGKLWARKSDLSEHMRVHTGVKPYCCLICPQKFTQASSLKRHQVVHMDTKPIQCSVCSKLFKCEQYFKRHVRKHEKESQHNEHLNKCMINVVL